MIDTLYEDLASNRYGGIYNLIDNNGKAIERAIGHKNDPSLKCACYSIRNGLKRFEGYRYGKDAIEWVFA